MFLPIAVFVFVTTLVICAYWGSTQLPDLLKRRQLDRRLRDLSATPAAPSPAGSAATVVKRTADSPLPAIDRVAARTRGGVALGKLIEQAGIRTSTGVIVIASLVSAVALAFTSTLFLRQPWVPLLAGAFGVTLPTLWLMRTRSVRFRKFEEQFPEALDLLSRAIRAGHAFQTAMNMVADELPTPVGPEFRKTFEQQNYGLPLRDALNAMSDRIPIIDVRFFVTAVLIQRETGGNLAEILDNLAHVVRERFKVLRQVRVHTAHGRFTGYVLLALPAALAVVLSFINPEHMELLFNESMGKTMLVGAVVMQTIGYFWIKRVIKIEV